MDVKGPVRRVDQCCAARSIIFVPLLHGPGVPVSPVDSVFENSQGEWVGQDSIVDCVSVAAL